MEENKSGLYIVAIVGVIALVAMVVLVSKNNARTSLITPEDATGQMYQYIGGGASVSDKCNGLSKTECGSTECCSWNTRAGGCTYFAFEGCK